MIFGSKFWAELVPTINNEASGYLMFAWAAMLTVASKDNVD